jgi:hypothetical protein
MHRLAQIIPHQIKTNIAGSRYSGKGYNIITDVFGNICAHLYLKSCAHL